MPPPRLRDDLRAPRDHVAREREVRVPRRGGLDHAVVVDGQRCAPRAPGQDAEVRRGIDAAVALFRRELTEELAVCPRRRRPKRDRRMLVFATRRPLRAKRRERKGRRDEHLRRAHDTAVREPRRRLVRAEEVVRVVSALHCNAGVELEVPRANTGAFRRRAVAQPSLRGGGPAYEKQRDGPQREQRATNQSRRSRARSTQST